MAKVRLDNLAGDTTELGSAMGGVAQVFRGLLEYDK